MEKSNIKDLIKMHPQHTFFELNAAPNDKYLSLANLDDLFKLSTKIGYFVEHFTAQDEAELFLNNMYDVYINYDKRIVEPSDRFAFDKYVANKEDEFIKDIKFKARTTLTLIGIDTGVKYYSDGGRNENAEETLAKALPIFQRLYGDFKKEQNEQARQLEENILNCISTYKKAYTEAYSIREKERIITKVQLELKAKYKITSSSDYRANKEFIRSQYEN